MKKILMLLLLICSSGQISRAQFFNQQWINIYNYATPENSQENLSDIQFDIIGNSFVTGVSYLLDSNGNATSKVYSTIKYAPDGTQQWVHHLPSPTNNGTNIYTAHTDLDGSTYLGGSINIGNPIIYILKINSNGMVEWEKNGNDLGLSYYSNIKEIFIDTAGSVFATGTDGTFAYDQFVIKLNTIGGLIWNNVYSVEDYQSSGIAYDQDAFFFLGADSLNIYKIDLDGNIVWRSPAQADSGYYGGPSAISIDSSGNIYRLGSRNYNSIIGYRLDKINSDGTFGWAKNDFVEFLGFGDYTYKTMHDKQKIYVSDLGGFSNFYAIDSNGTTLWTKEYDTLSFPYLINDFDLNYWGNIVFTVQNLNNPNAEGGLVLLDSAGNMLSHFLIADSVFVKTCRIFGHDQLFVGGDKTSSEGIDFNISKFFLSVNSSFPEKENGEEITAFPNPTNGYTQIYCKQPQMLQVLSLEGKLIESLIIKPNSLLDLKNYENGIYFLHFDNFNGEIKTLKVIKN